MINSHVINHTAQKKTNRQVPTICSKTNDAFYPTRQCRNLISVFASVP